MRADRNVPNPPSAGDPPPPRRWSRGRDVIDGFMVLLFLTLAFTAARNAQARIVLGGPQIVVLPTGEPVVEPGAGLGHVVEYGGGWSRVLAALAAFLLIGVIRRRPRLVAACLAAAMVEMGVEGDPWDARYLVFLVGVLAIGYVASSQPRSVAIPTTLIIAVPWMAAVVVYDTGDTHVIYTAHLPVALLLTALAWLIGDSTRERRAHRDRLRAEHTAQAVTTERLRIARELHDMIAHSIGIIAIQAGVGSRVIGTQPEEARKALQAIEETSRDTLSGLRRTLTALRQTDPTGIPTDPAPGLADLEKLVASTRRAGVRVELVKRGLPRPMPTDIDLAAYRIVQESVTNVVRHAGTHQCRVIVEYDDRELGISVADDGHGVFGTPGGGFGLVGMRERVHLLHGEFGAGPRPGGGFLVTARIPVPGFGTAFAKAGAGDKAEAGAAGTADPVTVTGGPGTGAPGTGRSGTSGPAAAGTTSEAGTGRAAGIVAEAS